MAAAAAAAAAALPDDMPHVLVVSSPGQGNVNPLLRFAKLLASKGLLVTFSSTLDVGRRLIPTITSASPSPALIPVGRGLIRFEFFSDGWDLHDPRHGDPSFISALFLSIHSSGPSAVSDLIRHQSRPVVCVINDIVLPWVVDVAHSFSIPSAVLWIQSCAVFSVYYHYFKQLAPFPSASDPDVIVSLPNLPALSRDDLPTYILDSNPFKNRTATFRAQVDNLSKATWVLVNSFEALERDVIEAVSSRLLRIIPVGPLVEGEQECGIRGDQWRRAADAECVEWLDAQDSGSVVYVALGSNVVLSQDEMGEMARGLMSSGSPFLWVVRDDSRHLLPQEFVEAVSSRRNQNAMVINWSSQERVLSHRAVGCFLSHCGWNSTLEALAAGVPMIAFPRQGDQQPDAKFIVDVYGVGVRLKAPVERQELKKCIEEIMRGEKTEMMKAKALKWKDAARKAAAVGGSSDRNVQAFVDEILNLVN